MTPSAERATEGGLAQVPRAIESVAEVGWDGPRYYSRRNQTAPRSRPSCACGGSGPGRGCRPSRSSSCSTRCGSDRGEQRVAGRLIAALIGEAPPGSGAARASFRRAQLGQWAPSARASADGDGRQDKFQEVSAAYQAEDHFVRHGGDSEVRGPANRMALPGVRQRPGPHGASSVTIWGTDWRLTEKEPDHVLLLL
jgi:hypothetical protein